MAQGAILFQSVEKKGTFVLIGDVDRIRDEIKFIPGEYLDYTGDDLSDEEFEAAKVNLSPDQLSDMQDFEKYVKEDFDWEEIFKQIPRKANGTFYKNRVVPLARGYAFSWDSEEEYGRRGPELRIKTHSDTEAHLEFFHSTIIEKW